MWTFGQNGHLLDPAGKLKAVGYSGHGIGVNNPVYQNVPDVGPIPVGTYTIGEPHDDTKVGKYAMSLTPTSSTETFGRSDFFMHGDSIEHEGQEIASHGCIVMPRVVRESVWDSGDHVLEVVRDTSELSETQET